MTESDRAHLLDPSRFPSTAIAPGERGRDPHDHVAVMSTTADALYQFFEPMEFTLVAMLRILYAQSCRKGRIVPPVSRGEEVALDVKDDELAARLHCSLNAISGMRRSIQHGVSPVATLVRSVTPVTRQYGSLAAVHCWRWVFYDVDPELTPGVVEHAHMLALARAARLRGRGRRATIGITLEERRAELVRQRSAKHAPKERGAEQHAGTPDPGGPSAVHHRRAYPDRTGTVPPSAAPTSGAVTGERSGAAASPGPGAARAAEIGAARAPVLEARSPTTNYKYVTSCGIQEHVKEHVVRAARATRDPRAQLRATRGGVRRSEAAGRYRDYRQVLMANAGTSRADLADFEAFLERYVQALRPGKGELAWPQYRGFFRHWKKLGDARATGIAATVLERVREGSVRSPDAYLMAELQRCAALADGTADASAKPVARELTVRPSPSAARDDAS